MKNQNIYFRLWAFMVLFIISGLTLEAQPWMNSKYLSTPYGQRPTLQQSQDAFKKFWGNKPMTKSTKGWKQYERWRDYWSTRLLPDGTFPPSDFYANEYKKYEAGRIKLRNPTPMVGKWQLIGPKQDPTTPNGGIGMGTGRCNILRMDPNDPDFLWVGSADGGIWTSNDAGITWHSTTLQLPSLGGAVNDIALTRSNSNVAYAITGDNTRLGIEFDGFLFKTEDKGKTWKELHFPDNLYPGLRKLIVHPLDENILLGVCDGGYWDPGYIVKSEDGGKNWFEVQGEKLNYFDIEIKPENPDFIYVSTSDGEILTCDDFGTSKIWNKITLNRPGEGVAGAVNIEVCVSNPEWIYALAVDKDWGYYGLFLSKDSAKSWDLQSDTPNIVQYDMQGKGGLAWYCFMLGVSPHNPNELFVGGPFLTKSTDGGKTWIRPDDQGGLHPDLTTYIFHPKDKKKAYCANDGSVQVSENNGLTWKYASNGMIITRSYDIAQSPTEENLLFIGQQDNGTFRYYNKKWNSVFGGDGMTILVHPKNPKRIYCSWQQGHILYSDDKGDTFYEYAYPERYNEEGPWVTRFAIHPEVSSRMYVCWRQLYANTGSGGTFVAVSNFPEIGDEKGMCENLVIPNKNGNIIYVYRSYPKSQHKLFKTGDSGKNWIEIQRNLPIWQGITSIIGDPNDPNTLWITMGGLDINKKVYRTKDGGLTWENISGTLPNLGYRGLAYHNTSEGALYVASDYGKVFYRNINMSDWAPINDGLTYAGVNDMDIFNNPSGNSKLRICTWGRGVWELDIAATITPQCEIPKNIRLKSQTPISATIEWDKVPGAVSYIVAYRPVNKSTGWQYQTTKETYGTISFPDLKIKYDVKVQSVCEDLAGSPESNTITVGTKGSLFPGMVARYNFCNGRLLDLSSNKLDGEIKGSAIPVAGKMSDALYLFNGENDVCNDAVPNYFQLPAIGAIWKNGFTFGALVRFDKDNNSRRWERIFDFSNGAGRSNILLARYGSSNTLSAHMYNYKGDIISSAYIEDAIFANQWMFVVVTIENTNLKVYINGNLSTTAIISEPNELNVARFNNYLGKTADGWCDHNFLGAYDEVRLYNRSLTSTEISEWYNEFSDYQNTGSVISDKYLLKTRKDSAQFSTNTNGFPVSYEWKPVAGLNNPNISNPKATPEVNTTYTCTITFPDGCVVIDSISISVDYTGIDANNLETGIQIYPNPANDKLNIKYELPIGNTIYGSLENMLGQNISTFEAVTSIGEINLDVKNIVSGIYLLKISDKFGRKFSKKIIIE